MNRLEKRPARRVCLTTYIATVLVMGLAIVVLSGISLKLILDRRANPIVGDIYQGQVRVNDGISDVWITPWEGSVASGLTAEDFSVEDGSPVYLGEDYKTAMGIDVSEWQGEIDWNAVKKSGVDFAFIRVGLRGTGIAGLILEDETARTNLENAHKAGVQVGVYFFSQAITAEEGAEEAAFVLDIIRDYHIDLPVMYDWERVEVDGARTANLSYGTLNECAAAFCSTIEDAGYEAGIYSNRQLAYYAYQLGELKDYDLWIADFNSWPDFYYRFSFWQYSDASTCPGIQGAVDRNMMLVAK